MKRINLAEPFEKIWVALSSLPLTDSSLAPRIKEAFKQTKVRHLLREIYEAANGRQVATTIGLVAIAPPIAPYLGDEPFCVNTQADFLSQALARIADGIRKRPIRLPARSTFNPSRGLETSSSPKHKKRGLVTSSRA
jgi:hypothetical protein